MDGDRRRKTVIAGTFAIRRKSLSNAQPISADRSQRIKAEMTMASSTCQRFTKPAPTDIYAPMFDYLQHSLIHLGAGRGCDRAGWGWLNPGMSMRRPGRENRGRRNGAGLHTARSPIFLFQTPAIFFEELEMPKQSGSEMKTTRLAPRPLPPSRPIKSFAQPAPGPHHNPPASTPPKSSNEVASSPGGIDPRQMHK